MVQENINLGQREQWLMNICRRHWTGDWWVLSTGFSQFSCDMSAAESDNIEFKMNCHYCIFLYIYTCIILENSQINYFTSLLLGFGDGLVFHILQNNQSPWNQENRSTIPCQGPPSSEVIFFFFGVCMCV